MKTWFWIFACSFALAQPTLEPVAEVGDVIAITHAGDERLFITTRSGRILILKDGVANPSPFLDISNLVSGGCEYGLFSVAFDPDYAVNGRFFLHYTNVIGDSVIARYEVSADDPDMADPTSARILMTIDQPFCNHNGGQVAFGPDGHLYVGMGDGGSADDPFCFSQNPDSLLGKMLRLDVAVDSAPYFSIPADNPFVGDAGVRDEIWSFGLRNPWRFSFDRRTGDLYIADVGQDLFEEVSFEAADSPGGLNYGWNVKEGNDCFNEHNPGACNPGVPVCASPDLTDPIITYGHGSGRCSITGGYLYRGFRVGSLYNRYVYGDFCSQEIFTAHREGSTWIDSVLSTTSSVIVTFGEDVHGELYVESGGVIYRFVDNTWLSLIAGFGETADVLDLLDQIGQ